MKLYYSPGACSLSPHIVLREAGLDFDLERVDIASGKTQSGDDFSKVNPKGYVPALRLDDGHVLTEGAAIVQFIADMRPEMHLAPEPRSLQRAQLHEHLNFIASEVHKAFGPFFSPTASAPAKAAAAVQVGRRLDYMERVFADGRSYLLGENFSVADAYLFVMLTWTAPSGIELNRWPHLTAFSRRVAGRKTVRDAMHAEGLLGSGQRGL